jgi:hypothetical protein
MLLGSWMISRTYILIVLDLYYFRFLQSIRRLLHFLGVPSVGETDNRINHSVSYRDLDHSRHDGLD